MSTANPLPIQAVGSPSAGKTTGIVAKSPLAIDSKGTFGGVLSAELDQALGTNGLGGQLDQILGAEKIKLGLPSSGKSLPESISVELEAEIALLDQVEGESILPSDFQIQLPLTTHSDNFGISLKIAQPSADVLRPIETVRSLALGDSHFSPVKPVESKLASPLATLADLNLDTEVLPFTPINKNDQLQNLFSPLVRQSDVRADAGQIARVIEQFSELTQRTAPAATATVPASVNAITPLSESGLSSSASGVAQLSVDVPVQDSRWQKAFSQRVVWSVGNNQSAQLRIHPAELGRIDIQVNVENDKASVVFNTQHGMVKDAIEQALPRLREMLSEQGVDLVDVDVSHDDIGQQRAGAEGNSAEQNESNGGVTKAANEHDEGNELISHIAVEDDAIDYFV